MSEFFFPTERTTNTNFLSGKEGERRAKSGCDRKRTDGPFSTERTVRSLSTTTTKLTRADSRKPKIVLTRVVVNESDNQT